MRALVLGGGGIAGIAWETGILHGLGPSALDVDIVIGTSAGSAVAAALTSGVSLEDAFAQQTTPAPATAPAPSLEKIIALFTTMQSFPPDEARRKLGELAVAAETMPEDQWKRLIGAGLPSHEWPERKIGVVACEVTTGETRVFDKESGVDLLSAVSASCAVPGVFPPVTIDGKRYMDGGVRTTTNADLVQDYDEILVIAPIPDALRIPHARVITPDEASLAAMTTNVLDPATRVPSAHAGLAQGKALR
ncbi:patatin-like phospholipase family protein [Actinocrispum sp. NPDC049592]|uniref:patatin-like phospholipase family protein n=1 Tax=Actinocrispum sp. NPDC049592 TaxID=3154835 RepID=UPI00341C24B0